MASPRAPFIAPTFHRAAGDWNFSFPYSNLNDQLKDAQLQWQKGAGAWTNQFNPQLQTIKNSPPGGLLSYFNNLFKPAAPGGGGTPTRVYGPGERPPQTNWNGDREPVVPYDPNRTSRTGTPTPWTPDGRTSRTGGLLSPSALSKSAPSAAPPGAAPAPGTGYGGSQGSGGLAAWQDAQKYMSPEEIARLSSNINAQGQYDPSGGKTPSSADLVGMFNSLPENRRGDFVNAWDQWSMGKVQNGGAQLQQALRDSMGKSTYDAWYNQKVYPSQGSRYNLTGLPDFLQTLNKPAPTK
jgi:hypothetical protein